jgi:hypothetical protein
MTPSFSLIQFRDWARTKPADERYFFQDCRKCALAQFLLETGRAHYPVVAADGEWFDRAGPAQGEAGEIINHAVASSLTFGDLADRLDKLCSDTWTSPAAYLSDIESVEA